MGINEEKYKKSRRLLLNYLHKLAKEKGITHQAIANKTGFTSNNVSRMLQGRYSPSLDNFIRLAEAIDYDVAIINKLINSIVDDNSIDPKFLLSVDPVNNELYILHRQFPSCLILIKQEIPVRFIVQDLYDDMDNPADILNMPFVNEAKDFYTNYSESILNKN